MNSCVDTPDCHPERSEGPHKTSERHADRPCVVSHFVGGPSPRNHSGLGMTARLCFPRSISSVDHCRWLMQKETPAYKRIVLKLSGEAMQEHGGRDNISLAVVREIAERIKEVRDLGVQVSIVIGGGNIWRGLAASYRGMDRTTADYMGMLATVINALALRSALDQIGVQTRVQTAIDMRNVAEPFILGRAIRHLELGRVVIFAAGTGNPYFSTDTTAALRASEIRADVILKATKVDGVYDRDPNK